MICSHFGHGVYVNGASHVALNNCQIYNNSQASSGVKSGVYVLVLGSGRFYAEGGCWGKNTQVPSYTENQKYGVEMDSAYNGQFLMRGVNLQSNNTGSLSDSGLTGSSSRVSDCPGYTPRGMVSVTVGSSPFTYTAGLTMEYINLTGGSVSSVYIPPVIAAGSSPCHFVLLPKQACQITYSSAPTMLSNKS